MTCNQKDPPRYIPDEFDRDDWEQLMIERGEAILEDEAHRTEWARR